MSNEINLTASMRSSLITLQNFSDQIDQNNKRLSTGLKINSPIDDPVKYFAAKGLNDTASDFSGRLDSMGQNVSTVEQASNGLKSIEGLFTQAKGLTESAKALATTDATGRAALSAQFDALRTQVDAVAGDSTYKGVNLLMGDVMDTIFNPSGSNKLTITGATATATGFSVNTSLNSWASNSDITTSGTEISTALGTLRSRAQNLSSNLNIIKSRQDFSKDLINTLREGAGKYLNIDPNEEAAQHLALQTRSQLGMSALSLNNQQQQSILQLFR